MKFIDTHSHLYLHHFNNDIEEVISRAKERGVSGVVLPNISSSSINSMLNLSGRFAGFLYPAIGLHPGSVKANFQEELRIIEEHLSKNTIYSIGEIGIDCYWDKTYLKEQINAFEFQMELASKHKLPVIIHCRDSFDIVVETLNNFRGRVCGVLHAFTGALNQAKKIIDFGFKIGIGGIITYKNSELAKVAAQIPLSEILLETDSPYLTPVPYRGKRNESSYLIYIAEKIAEVKNIPIGQVSEITTQNAKLLFGIN